MKILQIFGAVVAVHLIAFLLIFASPGCQSGPRELPTPDATVPTATATPSRSYGSPAAAEPVDLGTPVAPYVPAGSAGHATPTRPGSAAAVTVTPPTPVENVAPVSTYTVTRGDSLWSISKKHGLTVGELAKANSISTGTVLRPGRKLIIPGQALAPKDLVASDVPSMPAEKSAAPVRPANGEAVTHTVVVGESLGVIARRFDVTVGELAAANNITDPSKVRAGQVLVIPGFKAVSSRGITTVTRPAAETPATAAEPAPTVPRFEIAPPPPGEDLDSGLKESDTEVPTIRVEEPAPAPTN